MFKCIKRCAVTNGNSQHEGCSYRFTLKALQKKRTSFGGPRYRSGRDISGPFREKILVYTRLRHRFVVGNVYKLSIALL